MRIFAGVRFAGDGTSSESEVVQNGNIWLPPTQQGGIVFSSVCSCVCLSVCQHDNSWTVGDITKKFSGYSKGRTSSKMTIYMGSTGNNLTS